jgi:hypothetical protein
MNTVRRTPRRPLAVDLERVLEPLVSYICATDQPKAALHQAYAVLFSQVARVTDEARALVAARAISEKGARRVDFAPGCSTPA